MKFTKMHGIGNDYIFVNCFEEAVKEPEELSKKISDRHFGIGSDGLVLIMPSEKADFRMRIFNPDGSEAEMCGNAIRCVAKYVHDRNMIETNEFEIETTDVDEWALRRVRVGEIVDAYVMALEGRVLPVRVVSISPKSVTLPTGDIGYVVFLSLDRQYPDLRWGMTVRIEFRAKGPVG